MGRRLVGGGEEEVVLGAQSFKGGWTVYQPSTTLEWRSPLPEAVLQASREEEGGESQVGGAWGRLEDGGFFAFLLFRFQTNQSEEIICKKVKVIFIKSSSFIHL